MQNTFRYGESYNNYVLYLFYKIFFCKIPLFTSTWRIINVVYDNLMYSKIILFVIIVIIQCFYMHHIGVKILTIVFKKT
jgi:hypothetical protein